MLLWPNLAASTDGPGSSQDKPLAHSGPCQAAASDVLFFPFENRRPESVDLRRLPQIFLPKTVLRLLQRPALSTPVSPNFRVHGHPDKVGLVSQFVRPEAQLFFFEKRHV